MARKKSSQIKKNKKTMKKFTIGKKNIGIYDSKTKVFYKDVWDSKHRFRVLDAWGIDSETLNKLPKDTIIKINDLETGTKYKCLKKDYDESGQYFHFKEPRIDHKTQRFLARKHFQVTVPTEDDKERDEYLLRFT